MKTDVVPALGGKILRGYDKCHDYDFIYYNEVVKPALVGLAGPWISGGIEFNWPQHHRPTTYMPLEAVIEENADGGKTVWTGEVEPFGRIAFPRSYGCQIPFSSTHRSPIQALSAMVPSS